MADEAVKCTNCGGFGYIYDSVKDKWDPCSVCGTLGRV